MGRGRRWRSVGLRLLRLLEGGLLEVEVADRYTCAWDEGCA